MWGTSGTEDDVKHPCPVCGNPNAFPIWIDDIPPPTCPNDPAWPERTVTGICDRERRKAEQAAEFRKLSPECFDENGKILPGKIGHVLNVYVREHADKEIII